MNDKVTHQDYHPTDSPEYLSAAIDRIRTEHGMSERKEQFRERIGKVGASAYNKDGQRPCFPPYMEVAAEAVYAEALRDIIEAQADYREDGTIRAHSLWGPRELRQFAAERGIDLDDVQSE